MFFTLYRRECRGGVIFHIESRDRIAATCLPDILARTSNLFRADA